MHLIQGLSFILSVLAFDNEEGSELTQTTQVERPEVRGERYKKVSKRKRCHVSVSCSKSISSSSSCSSSSSSSSSCSISCSRSDSCSGSFSCSKSDSCSKSFSCSDSYSSEHCRPKRRCFPKRIGHRGMAYAMKKKKASVPKEKLEILKEELQKIDLAKLEDALRAILHQRFQNLHEKDTVVKKLSTDIKPTLPLDPSNAEFQKMVEVVSEKLEKELFDLILSQMISNYNKSDLSKRCMLMEDVKL